MSEAVVIGQLRVHAGGAGTDPLLLRLRAAHLLETTDLTPPGLPPGAILHIRRLTDPLPGRLSLDTPQLAPDRAWQAALTGRLGALAAQAERPLHQAVSAGAPAVLFADQAEMLACLALDWLSGQLLNHWWWRALVRHQPLAPAVTGAWLSALDAAPTALAHLNRRNAAVAFLQRLHDDDVAQMLTGLVERYRLTALDAVVRGAGGSPALPGTGAPSAGGPPAQAPSAAAEGVVARDSGPTGGDARPAGAVAPWRGLVPAESTRLSAPRQMLLGVGLTLVYAPDAARGDVYARQVAQWYAGRAADVFERPAAPLANAALAAEQDPDEPASPAHRVEDALRDADTARVGARTGREAGPASAPAEPRASAAPPEGGRPGVTTHRPASGEEPGRDTRAATDAGEAPIPAATAAGPPQLVAREGAVLAAIEVQTGYAGLFYLVNAALGLGFYADFTQPAAQGELALSPWAFLALIGRALIGDRLTADPVWGLLARLTGVEDTAVGWADRAADGFTPPSGHTLAAWVEATAGQVFDWVAARFAEPLADHAALAAVVLVRAGRVRVAAGRLDVVLRLGDLAIGVRMAGLDRNPGWVPAAGRAINFHYD